jgi:ribonuclease HI
MKTEIVHIWTDGACIGNPGPGGWAYTKTLGARTYEKSGYVCGQTTNIAMEMVAVIQALLSLKRLDVPVVVYTDLKMTAEGMNSWRFKWAANGWRASNKAPVANRELWEAIIALVDARQPGAEITFQWVKGHAGCAGNERADTLAEAAARRAARATGTSCKLPTHFDTGSGLMVPIFEIEVA